MTSCIDKINLRFQELIQEITRKLEETKHSLTEYWQFDKDELYKLAYKHEQRVSALEKTRSEVENNTQ